MGALALIAAAFGAVIGAGTVVVALNDALERWAHRPEDGRWGGVADAGSAAPVAPAGRDGAAPSRPAPLVACAARPHGSRARRTRRPEASQERSSVRPRASG